MSWAHSKVSPCTQAHWNGISGSSCTSLIGVALALPLKPAKSCKFWRSKRSALIASSCFELKKLRCPLVTKCRQRGQRLIWAQVQVAHSGLCWNRLMGPAKAELVFGQLQGIWILCSRWELKLALSIYNQNHAWTIKKVHQTSHPSIENVFQKVSTWARS